MTTRTRIPRLLCALLLAGLPLAGCFETESQRPKHTAWWDEPNPTPTPKPAVTPAPEPISSPLDGLFGPSKTSGGISDGDYTILLCRIAIPAHVEWVKRYKKATEDHVGWKYMFIIHKEDHSLLYWGRYKSMADAQPNLKKAKEYRTPAGIPVYEKAMIVLMPGKEDTGPPEWDLAKTPKQYVFSILIGQFYDMPEAEYVGRKGFAVDYCRQLRKQGLPAYYKHDETCSIVTVGLFERSAVQEVVKDKHVQRIVRDPRIKALFRRFPDLVVNGRKKLIGTLDPKTQKKIHLPAPSYLMVIPRQQQVGEVLASLPPAIVCELKLVHATDGTMLAKAAGRAGTHDLARLADALVHKLGTDPRTKGKVLAVTDFRNLAGTAQGAVLSEEFAVKTMAALLEKGWFDVHKGIPLRKLVPEKQLDNPEIVKAPQVQQKLRGLDYVVLGSVNATEPPQPGSGSGERTSTSGG